jgi:tetrahydromethanopterin S-methyltransferase subunit G
MFRFFDGNSYVLTEEYKSLLERIDELESKVKHLEEENTENSNLIYELMNSTEAIDRRIDIVAEEFRTKEDV